MDKPLLPEKPYFRIGEVAELLGVETYVLRYWESEFPQLRPVRAPSRQRLYRRADVETLLYIKSLLHEQGYTIAGAKRRLTEDKPHLTAAPVKGQQRLALAPPAAKPTPPAPDTPDPLSAPMAEPVPAPALMSASALAPPQAVPAPLEPPAPSPVVREVLDELRDLLKKLS